MNEFMQQVQNKYSFIDNILKNFWKSWIKSNLSLKLELKNIKWKNSRAKPGCAYVPTEIEQMANCITHGVWVIPSIMAGMSLVERSKTSSQMLVAWVYGTALGLLFCVSTFFHCSFYCDHKKGLKNVLHRCDRAMIYVFIVASYFPWLQLENPTNSVVLSSLEWIIWALAALGITYQQIFHERYKCLETFFYLVIGVGPAIVILVTGVDFRGMNELKIGGILYVSGIIFFKADGLIPMAHAIWHLFVVLAAGFHYYAISKHLFPTDTSETI